MPAAPQARPAFLFNFHFVDASNTVVKPAKEPTMIRAALFVLLFATLAHAADSNFALTIYSTADPATFDPQQLAQKKLANPYNAWQMKLPGYGVVREVRPIELKEGENVIRFSDVA